MDFTSVLLSGLISASVGMVLAMLIGLVGLKWLKSRIFNAILGEFFSFAKDLAKYPEAYEDLTAPVVSGAVNVIGVALNRLAADVEKNPQKYADLLKPVFTKAVKEGAGQMMPKVKMGDILGFAAMQIMQRFIGGASAGAGQVAGEAAKKAITENPFA